MDHRLNISAVGLPYTGTHSFNDHWQVHVEVIIDPLVPSQKATLLVHLLQLRTKFYKHGSYVMSLLLFIHILPTPQSLPFSIT
jgi:hypothetical protein